MDLEWSLSSVTPARARPLFELVLNMSGKKGGRSIEIGLNGLPALTVSWLDSACATRVRKADEARAFSQWFSRERLVAAAQSPEKGRERPRWSVAPSKTRRASPPSS